MPRLTSTVREAAGPAAERRSGHDRHRQCRWRLSPTHRDQRRLRQHAHSRYERCWRASHVCFWSPLRLFCGAFLISHWADSRPQLPTAPGPDTGSWAGLSVLGSPLWLASEIVASVSWRTIRGTGGRRAR